MTSLVIAAALAPSSIAAAEPGLIYMVPQGESTLHAFAAERPVDVRASRLGFIPWSHARSIGFDVSRDGAELVYMANILHSSDYELRVVDLSSHRVDSFVVEHDEVRGGSPKLSFDRQKVAVLGGWDGYANNGVRVYDRHGKQLAHFSVKGRVHGYAIDWLPDGRLVYADETGLWVVDARLEHARTLLRLATSVGSLSTSAAGRIAFEADGVILACDSAGEHVTVVAMPAPEARDKSPLYQPAWAPDGRHLAFEVTGWSYRLDVTTRTNGAARRLAIVDANGPPAVISAKITRANTLGNISGGYELSGTNMRFVQTTDKLNVYVGTNIVWR